VKRLGLHGDWHVIHRDVDGTVLADYWKHNILHDLGEQFLLRGVFAPLGTLMEVLCEDCSWVHGTLTLADVDAAGTAFVATRIAAGDRLYLAGGTNNEVTAGVYIVNARVNNDSVTLTTSPQAAGTAGGIVVLRMRRMAIGLDARTTLSETDTITAAEAYEEDGTGDGASGAGRHLVDPMNSASWTIAQDSDTGDYQATSAQVTFEATDADWQANRNAFLCAFTGSVGTPASEVLISSVAFADPITVGNGQSLSLQYRVRLREAT